MNFKDVLVQSLPFLWTAVFLLLTKIAFPKLTAWLDAKAADANASAATKAISAVASKVEHFAEAVVADLNATLKPALAEATADGKVTPEEAAKLRALALERMKALLGTAGLAGVTGVLGIGAAAVDGYLSSVVEKKVADAKG